MNIRNHNLLLNVNNKKTIIKMMNEILYYYQITTHPNIATLWINYININWYKINMNKFIKEFISIIEKFKIYPDLSINQICLLTTFINN